MPMSSKIELSSSSIHGMAWRAREDISIGEVVWEEGPGDTEVFTYHEEEVKQWPQEMQKRFYSLSYPLLQVYTNIPLSLTQSRYQVDEGVHQSPYGKDNAVSPHEVLISYYINHSCDGNMWYEGNSKLIACKNITKGEELNYDYALTETNPDWVMECHCKKNTCRYWWIEMFSYLYLHLLRGVIRGTDFTNQDLQARYGKHFLSYVLRKIEKM